MKLPRFTLRELFLLVAVTALGLGWWLDRARLKADYAWLVGEIQRQGREVAQFEERPPGFPAQITVDEARSFLRAVPAGRTSARGSELWDGRYWQTCVDLYDSEVDTPWVQHPVGINVGYACESNGTHLMYLILDGQHYTRSSRSDSALIWQRRWYLR